MEREEKIKRKTVIKKSIVKKVFDTDSIYPQQSLSDKGFPLRKECIVLDNNNYYTVAHSFEDIEKLIRPITVKGFVR